MVVTPNRFREMPTAAHCCGGASAVTMVRTPIYKASPFAPILYHRPSLQLTSKQLSHILSCLRLRVSLMIHYMAFPTREANIMSRISRRLQEGRPAGYDR